MMQAALALALGMFGLALTFCAWRLVRGPTLPDRILALDTLYVNALAVLVLAGLMFDTTVFFETALVIAMLGFVGTVSLAKYLARGRLIE